MTEPLDWTLLALILVAENGCTCSSAPIFNHCAKVPWCALHGLQVCYRNLRKGHLLVRPWGGAVEFPTGSTMFLVNGQKADDVPR